MSFQRYERLIELDHSLGPISPELNERASTLVINAIAQYPQLWGGAYLVADSLMMHTQEIEDAHAAGVSISDMAAVQPDPQKCARDINKIHQAFGIKREVTEPEAVEFVMRGAMLALESMRRATVGYADSMGISYADALRSPIHQPGSLQAPEETIDRKPAPIMHELLLSDEDLCAEVATAIMDEAEKIRRRSRAQQQVAIARQTH